MAGEMTKQWRKLKNCRTCRFASATDRERSYTPKHYANRCLYPTDQLPWPVMPYSLAAGVRISGDLERMKSGRAKKGIHLRDAKEGEGCPMWEEWQASL